MLEVAACEVVKPSWWRKSFFQAKFKGLKQLALITVEEGFFRIFSTMFHAYLKSAASVVIMYGNIFHVVLLYHVSDF